jgi:hypothetical protein
MTGRLFGGLNTRISDKSRALVVTKIRNFPDIWCITRPRDTSCGSRLVSVVGDQQPQQQEDLVRRRGRVLCGGSQRFAPLRFALSPSPPRLLSCSNDDVSAQFAGKLAAANSSSSSSRQKQNNILTKVQL